MANHPLCLASSLDWSTPALSRGRLLTLSSLVCILFFILYFFELRYTHCDSLKNKHATTQTLKFLMIQPKIGMTARLGSSISQAPMEAAGRLLMNYAEADWVDPSIAADLQTTVGASVASICACLLVASAPYSSFLAAQIFNVGCGVRVFKIVFTISMKWYWSFHPSLFLFSLTYITLIPQFGPQSSFFLSHKNDIAI